VSESDDATPMNAGADTSSPDPDGTDSTGTGTEEPETERPDGERSSSTTSLPTWAIPVLKSTVTVIAALLVLVIALDLTDGADDTAPLGSATGLSATTSVLPAAPAPSTTVDAAATTAAPTPTTEPAPVPPTAPGPDVPEPIEDACPSFTVDEDIPVQLCDRGALVAEIQTALTARGFAVEANGFFGSVTETAVRDFQASEGLEQDGVVGPITADTLLAS